MRTRNALPVVAALAIVLLAGAAAAQTTPYYITAADDQPVMWIVQGGAIQATVAPFSNGSAIAVQDTVLVCDYMEREAREYTLAGAPAGAPFTGSESYNQLLDGATDGVDYNYTVAFGYPTSVLRFDRHWQNPTPLVDLPGNPYAAAITYDPTTGQLFIAYDYSDEIHRFDLAGNDLGFFATGVNPQGEQRISALAYEAATDSLWFKLNGGGIIYNYSKAGTQLAAIDVPGLSGRNDWGGEMATAAAPANVPALSGRGATLAVVLLAAVGITVLRGRR